MNIQRIEKYYKEIEQIKRFAQTENESSLRTAFHKLLDEYACEKGYQLVTEKKLTKSRKVPDSSIFTYANDVIGYTESKDTKDDFETEITKKLRIGYPNFNIIFEDSENIVLLQAGNEFRAKMSDRNKLHEILEKFISYQSIETAEYLNAIEFFKKELGFVIEDIRNLLNTQIETNEQLKNKRRDFFNLCKKSINQKIRVEDIDEMIIQHILTNEIFSSIYDRSRYHTENNIAKQLNEVVNTFFTEQEELKFKAKTDKYYKAIKSKASKITDINDKQKFIKEVYEQFYKIYNPKLADKLGIVFTPNQIVDFMLKSTDYFLEKYFEKVLSDKNVEIIDPATGTGTFICQLINYLSKNNLEYKYLNEIHANEISILPYYIANLNIEASFLHKTSEFKSFKNIVFVDTLDLVSNKNNINGISQDFYDLSIENLERIKNQNSKKISVIIGNPPYNANQISENDNNKNKKYLHLDGIGVDNRIKETYIKFSNAQKTKTYDMYSRFFRWASDRIENDGIVAFITNSSLIDSKTFDGFRISVHNEFQHIYVVDLGGYINKGDLSGNVFGIKTAVCISFFIKRAKDKNENCKINYYKVDLNSAIEKLKFLESNEIKYFDFQRIYPDTKGNWLNQSNSDFSDLIPLVNKDTKAGKAENAVFKLFANGVATNRDEWVYDNDLHNLEGKIKFFIDMYNNQLDKYIATIKEHPKAREFQKFYTDKIKWSATLKTKFLNNTKINFSSKLITNSINNPFCNSKFYSEKNLNDRLTEFHYYFFGKDLNSENKIITFGLLIDIFKNQAFAVDKVFNKNIIDSINCSQGIGLYYYEFEKNSKGEIIKSTKKDNITSWGLNQFRIKYKNENILKEDIFNYVYAVLHNPNYRKIYENDLKKEFPNIPFYSDFYKWTNWGKELMDLHLNYENVKEYELQAIESKVKNPNAKLKIDKKNKSIVVDSQTTLVNVPDECFEYFLGNKTAIEWILNQYKPKKYDEKFEYGKILQSQFNTYNFADYKDYVISLLKKVTTISVETMKIVKKMTENNDK